MRDTGLVLVTLCLAALIINLDTTIVNVALPALVRQIGATTAGLQWVVDAYNLVFAALVLAPIWRTSAGSATFTIVVSRLMISAARDSVSRISPLPRMASLRVLVLNPLPGRYAERVQY